MVVFCIGVWSPNKKGEEKPAATEKESEKRVVEKEKLVKKEEKNEEPPSPVWAPLSAGSSPTAERKEFRPVNFESPTLSRKNKSKVNSINKLYLTKYVITLKCYINF